MRRRSEKELDQALNRAFQQQPDFVSWFFGKTKFTGNAAYHWSRADYPWGKVSHEVKNQATGAVEVIGREGETDVLVVATLAPTRRVALHIENKLTSGVFKPYQAELYAIRAKAWAGNPKYESYEDWQTVLLAPRSFLERHPVEVRKFDVFIAHEDIAKFVPEFEVGGLVRKHPSVSTSHLEPPPYG